MFRAALLSMVFSLAIGQNSALLCRTWCHAHTAAASGCHHENSHTMARLAGDQGCETVVVAAAAVLREDARRDVSSQDAKQAIPVTRYEFARLRIDARADEKPWRDRSLDQRPLSSALRI